MRQCQHSQRIRFDNRYLYYVCNDVNKGGRAATCSILNIRDRAVEDFIVGIIGEMRRYPDVVAAALKPSNRSKGSSVRTLKSKIRSQRRLPFANPSDRSSGCHGLAAHAERRASASAPADPGCQRMIALYQLICAPSNFCRMGVSRF